MHLNKNLGEFKIDMLPMTVYCVNYNLISGIKVHHLIGPIKLEDFKVLINKKLSKPKPMIQLDLPLNGHRTSTMIDDSVECPQVFTELQEAYSYFTEKLNSK